MALFNKLFSTNKKKNANAAVQQNVSSQFAFKKEQVRILLYRECDWRGRRLLFDSSAVEKNEVPSNLKPTTNGSQHHNENTNGITYKYCKPLTDFNSIGEMIFGAVAMSFRGTSLKVHWLQSPARVMCSQVFLTPIQTSKSTSFSSYHGSGSDNNGPHSLYASGSDLSSLDTNSIQSFSMSLNLCVNDQFYNSSDQSGSNNKSQIDQFMYSNGDSGYSGTDPSSLYHIPRNQYSSQRSSLASLYSDSHYIRKISVDSSVVDHSYSSLSNENTVDGCTQRRILRSSSTSLEGNAALCDRVGYLNETPATNGVAASESFVGKLRRNSDAMEINKRKPSSGEAIPANRHHRTASRRARLGIAICVSFGDSVKDEMELFCAEHIAVFETILCRLRSKAESAYVNRQQFLQIMLKAWHQTSQWMADLFTAPRISNPVWLTLSNGSNKASVKLANTFMSELCSLLATTDTKDTNFFISTLLTAILTHHLGWVGTLASVLEKEKQKMTELSKSHPYNALWAQLSDLHGAIGHPVKISKTIIYGNQSATSTVDNILNVLTYFIRCSEVKRTLHSEVFNEDSITDALKSQYLSPVTEVDKPKLKRSSLGLLRTVTRDKDLSSLVADGSDLSKVLRKNVMNDIPNVLAYRDSRFIRQELRIGNAGMDTGLEMNAKERLFLKNEYRIDNNNQTEADSDNHAAEEAIELDENGIWGDAVNRKPQFSWGIERVEDGLTFDQIQMAEETTAEHEGVVFVLGENEELVNIKNHRREKNGHICTHHKLKKHSGVKFNFEQYPEIATNYIKNKNLDITEYNILEKGFKMEKEIKLDETQSNRKKESDDECQFCHRSQNNVYQTPSNASELKFSSDLNANHNQNAYNSSLEDEMKCGPPRLSNNVKNMATLDEESELKLKHPENILKILHVPMSASEDDNSRAKYHNPGFMPSLFSRITDHYIPDMILQGTTAHPSTWGLSLKQDLALSSRCASIEQFPTENIAIVANTETHDVRFITSHSFVLPPGDGCGDMVGMSLLVSSMLETVHAMWKAGISAYQCLSFIESKLWELYLQSEALAAFLLATEFCSMSSLTSALDLSANDIPLLLSVASIHSPQVTKKYGVSFRS